MTKRQIKSIYHWSLMGLVMGLPLLLTGLSYIPNSYNQNDIIAVENATPSAEIKQYQTNPITTTNDFVDGNIYKLKTTDLDNVYVFAYSVYYHFDGVVNYTFENDDGGFYYEGGTEFYTNDANEFVMFAEADYTYFVYRKVQNEILNVSLFVESDYLPTYYVDKTTTTQYVVNNGAYQVYQFNEWFINQPLNSWYKEIMDLTFGLPTSYSPMNNILYFPLYAVWVLVFDLLYDVVALVPCVFHNVLDKLKGEKE